MKNYGNKDILVIINIRPVRSIGVISGEQRYPEPEKIMGWIKNFSKEAWFMDTTEAATELGNPIFGNVVLVGALAKTGELPIDRATFESVVISRMPEKKVAVNLKAYDIGGAMILP